MNILERKMTEFQLHRYLTALLFFGIGTWAFGVGFWKWFGIAIVINVCVIIAIVNVAAGFWLYGWIQRRLEEERG